LTHFARAREGTKRARTRPADGKSKAPARRDNGKTSFVRLIVADENRRPAAKPRTGKKRRNRFAFVKPGALNSKAK